MGAGSMKGTPGSPQDEPRPRGHGTEWKPVVGSGQARLGLKSYPKAPTGVNAMPALCAFRMLRKKDPDDLVSYEQGG